MSLSGAMLTGFTGIQSNSVAVDVVGDNLANLNTTAFKGQRTLFETLFYQTLSEGEAPSDTSGGENPEQVGRGATIATIQRNFGQGNIESTAFPSDLAIEGEGLFILNGPDGTPVYTRDGAFRLDNTQTLRSAEGNAVQVFPADDAGQINPSSLSDLVIPLGSTGPAIATTAVEMNGQLNSTTNIATAGAVVTSQPLMTASGAATTTTALTELIDDNGLPLFASGDELAINASKGGLAIPESTFVVGTTGNTVGDLAGHLETVLGINTDPATGGVPGVAVGDGTTWPAGSLVLQSNFGEINAVALDAGSVVNRTGVVPSPLSFSTVEPAVGEGVTTSFRVFDSLGNPVDVRLRATLESKSDTGTVWRFYAESIDDTDLSPVLGTGTITFDANGQFVASTGTQLDIDRAGTGATTPLTFDLDLSALTGLASADGDSQLIMDNQDGAPAGIMTGFSIDESGVVTAAFSNQQTQVLGQVALATFINPQGLVALAENLFVPGVNSGDPQVIEPRTGVAGSIRAGALEQSNVEIAREFVSLIQSSTGISSAGRVVRVADQLLQELLLIVR
ncbi:MAG: flagellar hook-basal body complex protein [Phycisphaerae bacterium]|nr:flagellar hook-basal body complex protein [Phycisphaerae bacterium]